MRKTIGLLCCIALMTAACGGSGSTDPASADSCRDLVDVEINIVNAMIREMSGWSEDQVEDALSGGFPAELSSYEELLDQYSDRIDALDCDWDEITEWECDRVGRISTGNAAGRLIRDNFEAYCEEDDDVIVGD